MIQSYFSRTYFLLYSENRITLYRVQGQRVADKAEFDLSPSDDMSAALALVRQRYPLKADDTLIVGLPLRLFNVVNFTLPLAAAENLDEAVGYELTRHVPFDLDSCLFHHSAVTQGDRLKVQVVLALKEPLQPYLAALTASGLSITAIAPALLLTAWMSKGDGIYLHYSEPFAEFLVYRDNEAVFSTTKELAAGDNNHSLAATLALLQNHQIETDHIMVWNSNQSSNDLLSAWADAPQRGDIDIAIGTMLPPCKALPYKIELASAQILRKKRIKVWLQLAACALLLLSLFAYPVAFFSGKHTALATLESKLAVVRHRAETLDALRQDNQSMRERYERLSVYVHAQPQVVDILKELTDIISAETWLGSLKVHERRITLHGTSSEATTVIEALASSPLFQDVHFDSPVVKKGSQETFTIVALLK